MARAEAAQRAAHDASEAAKRKAKKTKDRELAATAAANAAASSGRGGSKADAPSQRSKVTEGRAAQRGALRGEDNKRVNYSRHSESEQRGATGMGQRRNGLPPARRSVSQPLGGHHGQATALPSSAEMDELRHKHSKVKRGGGVYDRGASSYLRSAAWENSLFLLTLIARTMYRRN